MGKVAMGVKTMLVLVFVKEGRLVLIRTIAGEESGAIGGFCGATNNKKPIDYAQRLTSMY